MMQKKVKIVPYNMTNYAYYLCYNINIYILVIFLLELMENKEIMKHVFYLGA